MTIRVPVLIVGGGPVGLALANELGSRGIDYLLVDQGDGAVTFPASENVFSRTMEHLRRWGIASKVRSESAFPAHRRRAMAFATSTYGKLLVLLDRHSNRDEPRSHPFSPEGTLFCPKMSFDPALRAAAEARAVGRLQYGSRLESFTLTENEVSARVAMSSDNTSEILAEYLVACDGARSDVRQSLKIPFRGTFGQGFNFAIYFRAPGLHERLTRHFNADLVQLHTLNLPGRPYLTTVDGESLWRLSVYIERDGCPEPQALLRSVIGELPGVEIIRAQPWAGHRVVAERYRSGRVFLAGDAAHLRWPKGGFGANTGIGDAVDIGWKLAAVLQGWGGSALLDSYEAERRPIAVRNVNEASNNRAFDALIQPDPRLDEDSLAGEAARQEIAKKIYLYRLREYATDGIQLGYRYRGSPICVPDTDLEPPDDHMLYVPSTWTGCRAPHAWLSDGKSMLDLFGDGFVLLRFDRSIETQALLEAARRMRVPLRLVDVDSKDIAALYERKLVLVRPDGHVAWRDDAAPIAASAVVSLVTGWHEHIRPARAVVADALRTPVAEPMS